MINIDEKYLNELPVGAVTADVDRALCEGTRLVVTAPPGSGKSTLLPLTIARGMGDTAGRIVMLEPRRAAARQIAMRMAAMLGEKVGQTVGYRMRLESRVSAATRIEVVTEGVMERMLIDDPTLDGVGCVVFDEFHERSLTADLCLALTLEAQSVIRDDLRLVIMSATIDAEDLCRRLDAPLVTAEGRMFNVEIKNLEDTDARNCAEDVAAGVRRAWREQPGNILAFLPGQAEILRCADELRATLPDALVMPLYGLMAPQEQYRALEYSPEGQRKIVLATPIAETSLTIGGITAVVDSGLCRAVRFNAATGLSRLETQRISMDMAAQRAGRAGRLSAGVCYRLFTRATEHRMDVARKPEIEDADLAGMMLEIAAWGGAHAEELPWITPPQPGHIAQAVRVLTLLGALDENGKITPRGRRMAALPCHPRIANMLVTAATPGLRALAADIAAVLEEKDPVKDDDDADLNTRIALLRQQRRSGNVGGRWARIDAVSRQYCRLVHVQPDSGPVTAEDTGMLVAGAYPERVAMQTAAGTYRLPSGETVTLSEADTLNASPFLAVASMGRRIFLSSPVTRDVLEGLAHWVENLSWNSREGRVIARNELRLGVLVIDSKPIDSPDRSLIAATIARAAVKEGRTMFDFGDDVQRLQRRIAVVGTWHPEMELPDVTTDTLLATAEEWLPMYLGRATTVTELRKIDLCEVIKGIVGYDVMERVDRIAPTHLRLPGGRNARIDYRAGTDLPVVSARLQDCLGMLDTPRLDNGTRPVLMELLSPGFKPVQLTTDLRGFWTTTYFEVRKELRRRYPKHRWPDDPLAPVQ